MTTEEATRIRVGDVVEYRGEALYVRAINPRGKRAPYFRLDAPDVGMVSHQDCRTNRELQAE